jgi:hypothetical protein
MLIFGLITGLHLEPATFRGNGRAYIFVATTSIAVPTALGFLAGLLDRAAPARGTGCPRHHHTVCGGDRHLRLRNSASRPRRNPARDGFAGPPHGKLGPGDCRRSRCVALDPVGPAVVGPGRADIRRAGRVCESDRPAGVSGSDGDDLGSAGAGARNWSASSEKSPNLPQSRFKGSPLP